MHIFKYRNDRFEYRVTRNDWMKWDRGRLKAIAGQGMATLGAPSVPIFPQ